MDGETNLRRIGGGASLPMSLLLVIFFFLPWVSIQCGGMEIGQSSGWQLTVGDASEASMLQTAGSQPQARGQSLSEHVDARPWFILGLAAPVALLAVGFKGFNGTLPSASCGKALIGLGAVGVLVVVLAANVGYSEIVSGNVNTQSATVPGPQGAARQAAVTAEMSRQMEEQFASQIQTQGTGILWASLVLHILVMGCGAASLLLPDLARSSQVQSALPSVGIDLGEPPPPAATPGQL